MRESEVNNICKELEMDLQRVQEERPAWKEPGDEGKYPSYRRGAQPNADVRDTIPPNPPQQERVHCTSTPPEDSHTEGSTTVVNMDTGNQVGACHTKEPTEAQRFKAKNIKVHAGPSGAGNMFKDRHRKLENTHKKEGLPCPEWEMFVPPTMQGTGTEGNGNFKIITR